MMRVRSLRRLLVAATCCLGFAPATGIGAAELPGKEALRAAIEDLIATFKDRYPQGNDYLARLERVANAAEFEALRREALLANPLVAGQPILFVVRPQYRPDHHNTETMFQTGEINTGSFQGGGAVKVVRVGAGTPETETVGGAPSPRPSPRGRGGIHGSTPSPRPSPGGRGGSESNTLLALPEGIARDPDVSFDGRKILFSMRRNRDDDYHVYETAADGSGLKQLTFGPGVSDIDPIYLADDRILFTSTREPKYCMCNRHIMGNLFTMDADGANLQQIGHSTLHEGHASLLPDGRVLYDRWEYVDRNFGDAQGLWTCNPDGTNHAVYYGNNTASPGAKLEGRAIPGTEQAICTFSSCHDRPWGAMAVLDRRRGIDGRAAVVRTWPASAVNLVGHGNFDAFRRVHPRYEDPYPLSDKYFLCSRMTGSREQMGIYLIDLFGNEDLLHAEGPGCFDPMPLAPRPRPPVIPSRIDLAKREGYFYVADVYRGTGMERIPRGTVKWLRVVESPEKRFWTPPAWDGGTGQQAPGMAWNDFSNKRILGTVPVEEDGSASFAVPADSFVYFQLLDEKGMMVQSMRSGTMVRPGERSGCVGCHEDRRTAAAAHAAALEGRSPGVRAAGSHRPRQLTPWYGPPRNFSYTAEVQPVFDKHCVGCHDYGKEAGRKLNLAGDRNTCFNTSYWELRSKQYVRVIGAGPAPVRAPKTWGSHASRLTKVLLEGHGKPEIDRQVKLDAEGFDRIVAWIDINAPYYSEYAAGAYRRNQYGRNPLDGHQMGRLGQLTGGHRMTDFSFTRPELSPCLAKFHDKTSPQYCEALAILRAGQQALAKNPRPDMPGFSLSDPIEVAQQGKYDALQRAKADARAAILAGKKRYEGAKP